MKHNFNIKCRFGGAVGFFVLTIAFIVTVICSLRFGSVEMSAKEFFKALLVRSDSTYRLIIYSVRLPRTLAAILAGVGLSVSGVLLQGVTDNSLASPNVIGVNSGAGFGVVICLAIIPFSNISARFALLPVFAFAFAFLTTVCVIAISTGTGGSKTSILLAGIAVTALLNAFISAITLINTDTLTAYNSFSIGGFSGIGYRELIIPACIIALSITAAAAFSRKIDILCLGTDAAALLGVRVRLVGIICIMVASAAASAVVSFAGLLGFVGLIVPHIARGLFGSKTLRLIPSSAIIGATLTTFADLVGRVLVAPSEIPVGIMMAIVGAPFFIFLLFKKRGEV